MDKEKHLGGKENKKCKKFSLSVIYISMIMYLDDLEVVIWQSCIWLTVNALTKVMGLKSCLIILDNFASWKCVGFFCFYKTVFKTDYVLFYCYISLKCIKGIK